MSTEVRIIAVIAVTVVSLGMAGEPTFGGRELCFELVDGTVITGRIDIKAIAIRITSGNILKVPVAELTELSVGLSDRRGSVERGKPQSKIRAGKNTLVGTVTVKKFRIASPYGNVTVTLDNIRRIRPGFRAVSVKGGQWSVELRDKTHLRGMAISQSLRIKTRYGTMVVPLAQIQHCTFATDGKTISVQCRGSDRIVGSLRPKTTISFKADEGKMDISASKIAVIVAYDALTFDLGLSKGVTMKLLFVPAGKFQMGSPKTGTNRMDSEGPQREVTISKPFYMGAYEVTQSQWRAVMGTEPWAGNSYAKSGDSNAASYISWEDANKFCEILSKKTGKKVTLPTEAQWEYSCRAESKAAYCFGDDSSKLGDYAWYKKNAFDIGAKYAHAVAQKKPNAFGLYDMHGNVWEWCRDWYDEKFYAKAKNVDPENTSKPRIMCRVLRGGSWFVSPQYCRAADRSRISAVVRDFSIGFRVVVESGGIVSLPKTSSGCE